MHPLETALILRAGTGGFTGERRGGSTGEWRALLGLLSAWLLSEWGYLYIYLILSLGGRGGGLHPCVAQMEQP